MLKDNMGNRGFSLVELMMTAVIFSVVSLAGFLLFSSGLTAWTTTDATIELQENLRSTIQRITGELQESGKDEFGDLKVSILDNAGPQNTDILRFSIPLCLCGRNPIDENGNVRDWGAPLRWNQTGCPLNFSVNGNNQVTICHLPNGDIALKQTLDVNLNTVDSHLVHGDWPGDCNACDPTINNNRWVEYALDPDGRLLRRVLNAGNNVVDSSVIAQNVVDFQINLSGINTTMARFTVKCEKNSDQNRRLSATRSAEVVFRNGL